MRDLEKKLDSFPNNYAEHFQYVWNWKCDIESGSDHILDENNLEKTFDKLTDILPRWQTYRPRKNRDAFFTLQKSLKTIQNDYDTIRKYSLIEFEEIPQEPLIKIWNELGRVKEPNGEINSKNEYYIIAVCKPLMLLWGQTLAFDKKVRDNLPNSFQFPRKSWRWTYRQWHNTMVQISKKVNQNDDFISFVENNTRTRYRHEKPVPYGRYLDIYYWVGNNESPKKPRRNVYEQVIDDFINSGHQLVNFSPEGKNPNYIRTQLLKCIERQKITNIEISVSSGLIYIEILENQ